MKTIRFLSIISCIWFFSCKSTYQSENVNYILKREISSTANYLDVKIFEKERDSSLLPRGLFKINNIYFNSTYNDNLLPTTVSPGRFNIEVSHMGKKTVKINNLLVKKNDSLIIKIFMEDSNVILEQH